MYPKFTTPRILTPHEQKRLFRVVRYPFHSLRHSAITNVYRATKDLYLTQRFARHASPLTTTAHTHPTDDELYEGIRRLKG